MGTVIVLTSGKGGTGKTALTAGLSVALAGLGHSVLCIDCDIGLRNLDISLGMTDVVLMDFTDVMAGRCSLERAAVPHPIIKGLSLLTAPMSLPDDGQLENSAFKALLASAREHYDYILIDSPAGLGIGFRLAICDTDEAIVVSTGDAASLRDAQRVVTELSYVPVIRLVVNRIQPKLLRRLCSTIDDLMDALGLPLLGLVPEDPQVILAASCGRPLAQTDPKGAAVAYSNIAKRLTGRQVPLMKLR
ncbi:MAG: septum site-determining protein MinD [Firmicutes bacterium]|nr:septum site-determining protein MinD [Bacillota bacterium]